MSASNCVPIPSNCVAIVSGGLDSTTLVYDLVSLGHRPLLLAFDYGQRHRKELGFAQGTANDLKLDFFLVDLRGVTKLISNSALTSTGDSYESAIGATVRNPNIPVPEGHYAEATMKQTVVPNRNMIMLSIAAGACVNLGGQFVATGVHAGDHFVYPDCRPDFATALNAAIVVGNDGFHKFRLAGAHQLMAGYEAIYAPYIEKSKEDIAYRALELGVPLHKTWSCYKGGSIHCGRCGTCVERLEAITNAQQRYAVDHNSDQHPIDRTEYADTEFWKTCLA